MVWTLEIPAALHAASIIDIQTLAPMTMEYDPTGHGTQAADDVAPAVGVQSKCHTRSRTVSAKMCRGMNARLA